MKKNPQIKDGFTMIANELYEAIIRYHCSGGAKDIIHAVIRATYGFQTESRSIGAAYLARLTGRHPRQVSSDVKRLIDANVLSVIKEHSFSKSRIIALNKDYSAWKPMSESTHRQGYELNHSQGMSESTHLPMSETTPIINKERNSKDILSISTNEIYDHYKTKVKPGASTDAKKSIIKLLKSGFTKEQLITSIDRYSGNGMSRENKYRIQANNFFGQKERFRDYLSEQPQEPTEQDIPQYLASELIARNFETKEHFRRIPGTELVHYQGVKDCVGECRKLDLLKKGGEA